MITLQQIVDFGFKNTGSFYEPSDAPRKYTYSINLNDGFKIYADVADGIAVEFYLESSGDEWGNCKTMNLTIETEEELTTLYNALTK